MHFSRNDVFEMVDALFHAFASDYRQEAKEELAVMMKRREDAVASEQKDQHQELLRRVELLEKIVGNIQIRLGFAGEPHKDQTYGPASVQEMIKHSQHKKGA